MDEGGFEYHEMDVMGEKYPEYADMNQDQLDDEYQNLSQERLELLRRDSDNARLENVKKRMDYIERIQDKRVKETSFTSNNDGTVTIKTRKDSEAVSRLEFPGVPQNESGEEKTGRPENEPRFVIVNFIKSNHD